MCPKLISPPLTMLALLVSAVMVAGALADEHGHAKTQKSLDDALLEDLDSGLPKPPQADNPAAKDAKRTPDTRESPPSKQPRQRSLDDELLEGLEGEDIGGPANENPLVRLNQRMKQVERRIAETHSDEKTQRLQEEISADLSKLIDQLEQQCRQSKNPSSAARQQQTASSKPASKPSEKPSEKPGEKPARDSSARTKGREAAKVDGARLQEMLKDVWGHLPPHLRQQMEQSANEEFLPKYETEISEYYRSLVGGKKERK